MANETIPAVEILINQKVLPLAFRASGLHEKKELPIDLGGAGDRFPVVFVSLAGIKQSEVL
jgi:hypothetical protein